MNTHGEIRVALIGFGFAGRVFHAPLIAATRGLKLTMVASSRREAIRAAYPEIAAAPDALAAVRDGDADLVVVASPNDSHAPLARAALQAGKHVVVDKPFTITLAEARALAEEAERAGRLLSVFQNRRWDSDFLAVREALAAGRVGEVREVRSDFSRFRPEVRDRWRERPGAGAGMWYDLGPHLVDQALVLFGPPESVQASFAMQRRGASAVDWFEVVLGYGARRVVLTSSMLAADAPARWVARGTEGALLKRLIDPQEAQLLAGKQPGSRAWGDDPDPLVVMRGEERSEVRAPAGNYLRYYEAMRDAIRGAGALPVTPAQATTLMAVIEAGIESAESGRAVAPEYTDAERAAW